MYHVNKTKVKVLYMSSGYCGSLSLAFVVGALEQYLLCFIIIIVLTIVGLLILYPKFVQASPEIFANAVDNF